MNTPDIIISYALTILTVILVTVIASSRESFHVISFRVTVITLLLLCVLVLIDVDNKLDHHPLKVVVVTPEATSAR